MSEQAIDFVKMTDDAIKVVTDPKGFYASMPQKGGFQTPIIFAVIMSLAAAAVTFVLAVLNMGAMSSMGFGAISAFIVYPIGIVLFSFIVAAIMYVVWRLMGSEKDFEVAVRCVAYSTAVMPIAAAIMILPFIGNIVQPIWGCLLMYMASITTHGREEQTSQIVFGILAAILVLGAIT